MNACFAHSLGFIFLVYNMIWRDHEKSGANNRMEICAITGGGVRRLMANAILSFHFLLTIPLAGLPLLKNFPIKRLLARWSLRKHRTTSRTNTPSCCSLSRTWDGNVVDVVGEGRRRATRWWEIVLLLNILMQVKKPTAFYSAEPWHGPHEVQKEKSQKLLKRYF